MPVSGNDGQCASENLLTISVVRSVGQSSVAEIALIINARVFKALSGGVIVYFRKR